MLQRNSLSLKIFSVFLAFGIASQSIAGAVKPSEKEAKQLEQEYQDSSDYTVPVVGAIVLVLGAVAGFHFFGAQGAVAGGAMAGMAAARSPVKSPIGKKEVAELLKQATAFQNSPSKK